MNTSIADLVAKHRDYCAQFVPVNGVMADMHNERCITIKEYEMRVHKHLTMTVTKIKRLNQ